ncbi:DUF4184 family protein [Streptomyces sp. NPDC059176]|uniref:DUF4184 family protein n=1 Tax=unclassified Streptomyces TaxID=2593676 RepID=UPI0036BEFE6B
MPFTLSHAAAVLPGVRRDGTAHGPLLASALIAGSFSPDMTYFAASVVPGGMEFGEVTHGPLGALTVDVLISAALVGLWLMARDPLLALLPTGWQGRVHAVLKGRRWLDRPPLVVALWFYVSAVIGAGTHIVWDGFTHFDRWGTRTVPALGEMVAGFPLYTYVQYGTSALAMFALVWFTISALRSVPAGLPPAACVPVIGTSGRRTAAALLGVCVLAGTAHRCVRFYRYWGPGRINNPVDIIPTICFGAGAGLVLGVVLYAAAVRLRMRHGALTAGGDTTERPAPDRTGVS